MWEIDWSEFEIEFQLQVLYQAGQTVLNKTVNFITKILIQISLKKLNLTLRVFDLVVNPVFPDNPGAWKIAEILYITEKLYLSYYKI